MGRIWTTPGFTDEKIWLYLATDLSPVEQALEDDEVLTIERMPLDPGDPLAGTVADAIETPAPASPDRPDERKASYRIGPGDSSRHIVLRGITT